MAEHILIDSDYENFVPHQSKIKWSTLDKEVGGRGCFVIFFLPLTILFLAGLIQTFAEAWDFRQQGVATEGTITKCEQRGGYRSGEFTELFYTYTVNAQPYSDSDTTDIENRCRNFPQGTIVPIQYLANDPQQSVYKEAIQPYQWGVINLFGLISLGCGLFVVWHITTLLRLRKQARRLNTKGQLLQGEVTYVEIGKMKKRRSTLEVKMWYEFVPPHQSTRKGIASKEYPDSAELHEEDFVGKSVTVLYDADDCFAVL